MRQLLFSARILVKSILAVYIAMQLNAILIPPHASNSQIIYQIYYPWIALRVFQSLAMITNTITSRSAYKMLRGTLIVKPAYRKFFEGVPRVEREIPHLGTLCGLCMAFAIIYYAGQCTYFTSVIAAELLAVVTGTYTLSTPAEHESTARYNELQSSRISYQIQMEGADIDKL